MIEVIHKKSKLKPVVAALPAEIPAVREDSQELCDKFSTWLDDALPGEKFCYYRGAYLDSKRVGKLVSRAYEKGLITMYQSRNGSVFQYWAIKTNGGNNQRKINVGGSAASIKKLRSHSNRKPL